MDILKKPLIEVWTDGGKMIEIDHMGREKFWEDLGRPNE